MEWIDTKDKLPIDLWKEKFPSVNNYENVCGHYLAVFEDRDPKTDKVWDEEVVAVSYHGKIGWTYYTEMCTPHASVSSLIRWMPFPDP